MSRSRNVYGPPQSLSMAPRPVSPVPVSAPAKRSRSARKSVLVVDDQHVVLELVDAFLEDSDYRVYLAGSGRQALEICARIGSAIDLLLTDVRMPGMNGPELAGRVLESHPGVRVLFMSGFQVTEAALYGVSADAALVVKPFRPDELLEAMGRVLSGAGERAVG